MNNKQGEYQRFNKHKKNGAAKRKEAKGCFGNKRNDLRLVSGKKNGCYY